MTDRRATGRPCEDCGGVVVAGLEPITAADDPELAATGLTEVGNDWCTDPACRSNHVQPGLRRTGVDEYTCTLCGQVLRTPMSEIRAHRRSH